MKAVKGIVVDDEQWAFLKQRLGTRRDCYHGLHKDFLDGWGGRVIVWPVDSRLLAELRAMEADGIPAPKVISGTETGYVARKAAVKRGVDRKCFVGQWGHCVCGLTYCTGHPPLAFFAKKQDADLNERVAREIKKIAPEYDPTKMELGDEHEDDDE